MVADFFYSSTVECFTAYLIACISSLNLMIAAHTWLYKQLLQINLFKAGETLCV